MKKIEIDNRFIGHAAQMYGVTPFEYTDGKAKGMRALELCNGVGIRLVMLPDRGLDILKLEYKVEYEHRYIYSKIHNFFR